MKFHKLPLITPAIASLSVLACSWAETSNPTAISGSTAQRPASKVEDVQAVSPALEYYSDRVVMGDLWKRPGLSSRDRSVVTVAAMISRNQTVGMAFYVNMALDNGVTASDSRR